jgi:hypothetical protein
MISSVEMSSPSASSTGASIRSGSGSSSGSGAMFGPRRSSRPGSGSGAAIIRVLTICSAGGPMRG